MPQIAIVGAGNIGFYVGVHLIEAGHDVFFLGRERVSKLLADEKTAKITVFPSPEDPSKRICIPKTAFKFSTRIEDMLVWKPDIVLIALKAISNEAVFGEIAAKGSLRVPIVSMQNGIGNADRIKKLTGNDLVYDGMVGFNVVADPANPLHFYRTTTSPLIIEELSSSRGVIKILSQAMPGVVQPAPEIKQVQYGKLLIVNLNNGPVALTNRTVLQCIHNRHARRLWAMTVLEGYKIVRSNGFKPARYHPLIPVALFPYLMLLPSIFFTWGLGGLLFKVSPKTRPSMSNDFASGAKTEVDFLQGEILRLGVLIDARPFQLKYNRAVFELVKEAEKLRQDRGSEWRPTLLPEEILAWAEGKAGRPIFQ